MEVLYPRCAGLDVHQQTVVACARVASGSTVQQQVRTFGTATGDLLALDCDRPCGGDRRVPAGNANACVSVRCFVCRGHFPVPDPLRRIARCLRDLDPACDRHFGRSRAPTAQDRSRRPVRERRAESVRNSAIRRYRRGARYRGRGTGERGDARGGTARIVGERADEPVRSGSATSKVVLSDVKLSPVGMGSSSSMSVDRHGSSWSCIGARSRCPAMP
jgi:hypothetical protein